MIIMINGPFGVGKTTLAHMLKKSINESMIFDPEEVGFMLRNIVTEDVRLDSESTGDFQDLIPWKELFVDVAQRLANTYKKNLIIPMTIWNKEYFSYIKNELKKVDSEVYHFCLLASKEIIHKRLSNRGDTYGSWAFQQTDKCLRSFQDDSELFASLVTTDNMSEDEVHTYILKYIEEHHMGNRY